MPLLRLERGCEGRIEASNTASDLDKCEKVRRWETPLLLLYVSLQGTKVTNRVETISAQDIVGYGREW